MQAILKISPNWYMDKEPVQTGLVTIGINKSEIYGEAQLDRAGRPAQDSHQPRHMPVTVEEVPQDSIE